MEGIDVSHWNDPITWGNLDAGKTFVIIKATDGATQDPIYGPSLTACRGLALQAIGSYHFFEPNVPPTNQFNNIVANVNLQTGDLRIAVDIENLYDKTGALTYAMSPADVQNVADLVAQLYANYGTYPIVYTSASVWSAMGDPDIVGGVAFSSCPLWIAHYTAAPAPTVPAPWLTWRIWQYSKTGAVTGIPGNADLDRTSDNLADLLMP
jgi:lysozyme